jgi:hypothetical protein
MGRATGAADSIRQQSLDRLSDEIGRAVPEGLEGPRVGVVDVAVLADREDRVRRGLQDGPEPALALGQRALAGLSRGDVDDRREDLEAIGGLDRQEADLHRQLGAILAAARQLEPDPHRSGVRVPQEAVTVAAVLLANALGKEHLDGLAEELRPGVPEGGLGARADVGDAAFTVDPHDGVGRGLEESPLEVLGVRPS